ncbi:autotransporter outer membrane beta-barrel domain-containing protein [bacterium]|nr:autotransporter outer membrane beta-barrel domain-containing protein [bacterium]
MYRWLLLCITPLVLHASETDSTFNIKKFHLRGYGTMNYFAFDWQTDPQKRNVIDLERLTLYPSYKLNERMKIESEIEIEHGGTGVTMEFDKFEEFGEFETEIEKGGEVKLEQMNFVYQYRPYLNFRIGRFKLPIGLNSQLDEPSEYFTTTRNETESSIIPTNWYENGIQIFGSLAQNWKYTFSLVNGLDATGFSSSSWIVRGQQLRFENVNAEDMAINGRLDYAWGTENLIGVSAYYGNSTHNRPKPDITVDGHVSIIESHVALEYEPVIFRSMVILGHLENADKISEANRNLSNNLNVKRSPIGSQALGYYIEAGLELFDFLHYVGGEHPTDSELILFGRYEFYDTMYKTSGNIFNNPRWERKVYTAGLNYQPLKKYIVFKTQYSMRKLGISQNENTFSLGMGFEF